jgi:hypothetical protein
LVLSDGRVFPCRCKLVRGDCARARPHVLCNTLVQCGTYTSTCTYTRTYTCIDNTRTHVYEGLFLRIYFHGSVTQIFDEMARRRLLSFASQFSLIDRKAGGWVCQNGPASLDDTPPSSASSQNRQDVGRPPPAGGRGVQVDEGTR